MFSLFRPGATGDTTATDATVMFSFILRVLDSRHRSSRNSRIGAWAICYYKDTVKGL